MDELEENFQVELNAVEMYQVECRPNRAGQRREIGTVVSLTLQAQLGQAKSSDWQPFLAPLISK